MKNCYVGSTPNYEEKRIVEGSITGGIAYGTKKREYQSVELLFNGYSHADIEACGLILKTKEVFEAIKQFLDDNSLVIKRKETRNSDTPSGKPIQSYSSHYAGSRGEYYGWKTNRTIYFSSFDVEGQKVTLEQIEKLSQEIARIIYDDDGCIKATYRSSLQNYNIEDKYARKAGGMANWNYNSSTATIEDERVVTGEFQHAA